jgi:large subunit ribosomal protein L21e
VLENGNPSILTDALKCEVSVFDMIKRKGQRTHGKIPLSRYFQEFKIGDKVAVVRELSVNPKFPESLQGRSGTIMNKRGRYYIVDIKDLNKQKSYIIHPVHLKKLETIKN